MPEAESGNLDTDFRDFYGEERGSSPGQSVKSVLPLPPIPPAKPKRRRAGALQRGIAFAFFRSNGNLAASVNTPEFHPHLAGLPVYVPGRPIEEVARELGLDPVGIVKLASNENPLGPSPKALEAMRNVLVNMNLYPDGSSFQLKRALARRLNLDPEHLILGNGSNEIIEFVGHAFLRPGDEVLVSEYCFAVYPIVTALFGATLVTVPARGFGADIPAMLRAITPRTRILFLANPNNPTGTLASREAMEELLAGVPSRVLLVLDEAYVEFLDDPSDCLPRIRAGTPPNLLLMRTFSKIFGLAGLRIGYGVASPEIIRGLESIRQPFNINAIAQAGALAALEDEEHLSATRANNRLGLDYLHNAFAQIGLEYVPSHANFVLVRVGDGTRVFQELQRRGVITRPMGSYGLPEWIRVSVGRPEENCRCVEGLREILGKKG
ncbi:MAG: histidinol-phosphate transaminase [Verrucomicrobiae bacterium]|nr:histidinol-phosphate transaminase [Verrucomicrobiae bacterium]